MNKIVNIESIGELERIQEKVEETLGCGFSKKSTARLLFLGPQNSSGSLLSHDLPSFE